MSEFEKIKSEVLNRLKNDLSSEYTYHNPEHTLYVLSKTIELAAHESLSEEETRLAKTAALYHDIGWLVSPVQHEMQSCLMARNELPAHGFDDNEIQQICRAIMATSIPQNPTSLIGEILADADLYYLGTDQYGYFAEKLFREIKNMKPDFSRNDWLKLQIEFIENHVYHTAFAKKNLNPKKVDILNKLIRQRAA